METIDFVNIIQNEYEKRVNENAKYSMAKFAQDLGIHKTSLSAILRRRAALSRSRAKELAERLNLSHAEKEKFLESIWDVHKQQQERRVASARAMRIFENKDYTDLQIDYINMMANWYYLAILEIIQLENFQGDLIWIAKRLGITELEVKDAVACLIRIGLLEITQDGKWQDTDSLTFIPSGVPSPVLLRLHKQFMSNTICKN